MSGRWAANVRRNRQALTLQNFELPLERLLSGRKLEASRDDSPSAEISVRTKNLRTEHQRCQFWREFSRRPLSIVHYPPNFPPAGGAFWHLLAPLRNALSAIGTARLSATTDAIDITIPASASAVGAARAKRGTFRVRRAIFSTAFDLLRKNAHIPHRACRGQHVDKVGGGWGRRGYSLEGQ